MRGVLKWDGVAASVCITKVLHGMLEKLNPTDEYEIEIQVMAEVCGYFQVAYKRVINNVLGFIDLQFLKGLEERLQLHIVKQLGLGTANANEQCARYLAEDPAVVARRDELRARQKRLESVQRELSNFELRLDYSRIDTF
ncbi:hypothetical protein Moror_11276 [Moniliophthora roreri MCA 2997]|nr:hypothetical protein Moror_11276 [Moniliophthora roreri MCA 2997]